MEYNFYRRYVGRYVLVHMGLVTATVIVSEMLDFDMPSSIPLVFAMAAANYAGSVFANDHHRPPEKREIRAFALSSTIIVNFMGLVLLGLGYALSTPEEKAAYFKVPEISVAMISGIAALLLALFYFVVVWGFKTGSKYALKALDKKREKADL